MFRKIDLIYFILITMLAIAAGIIQSKLEFTGMAMIIALLFVLIVLPYILKSPLNGLVLMAFFLPFEYTPSATVGGITFKINHLIAGLTILSWLVHFALGKIKVRLKINPTLIVLTLFYLSQIFSITQATHQIRAIQVAIFLTLMAAIFLLFSSLVQTRQDLVRVIKALIAGAAIAAISALWQFFGDTIGLPLTLTGLREGYDKITFGFPRMQSLLPEPLYFANYLFLPLFLLSCWWLKETGQEILPRRLQLAGIFLLFILLILTVARGAYLGLLAGLVLLFLFQFNAFLRAKNLTVIILTIAIVGLGVFGALYFSQSRALDEFIGHAKVEDLQKGESVKSRVSAMKNALYAWEGNPVFGIGLGNYGPYMENYPSVPPPDVGWVIVNNQYLETLCETGIVGLGGLVLFLTALLWRNFLGWWREKEPFLKATALGILIATVAVLVQYNTFSTIYILPIWFLFGLNNAVSTLILEKPE